MSLQRRQWCQNLQISLNEDNEIPGEEPPAEDPNVKPPWEEPEEPEEPPFTPNWKEIGDTLDGIGEDLIRNNKPWWTPLWVAKELADYPEKPDDDATDLEWQRFSGEVLKWLWEQWRKKKEEK